MGILILICVSNIIRETTIFSIAQTTTSNMHLAMCEKVLSAKIEFFDSNPIGRILTRFSKDMAVLDLVAPPISIVMTYGIFRALTVSVSICIINPWLLIPASIACGYLIYLMKNATMAMIEAQRLDAMARGPIHNLFTTLVNGLVSIRAYDQVPHFQKSFLRESGMSANVTFTYSVANRWLGFRFDIAILILTLTCACTSVFMRSVFDPVLLIFSLQVITDVTMLFSIGMRFFAEM